MSRGARGTESIYLQGIKVLGKVIHTHSLFCVSARDYTEPDLWGVLGPLPDKGTPSYIKITPLHLASSYSFLGVSHTKFGSALSGISTKGEDLEDLAQDPAAEADYGSRRKRAQGVCFPPPPSLSEGYMTLGNTPPSPRLPHSSFLAPSPC